jgi:hypothetical protein
MTLHSWTSYIPTGFESAVACRGQYLRCGAEALAGNWILDGILECLRWSPLVCRARCSVRADLVDAPVVRLVRADRSALPTSAMPW